MRRFWTRSSTSQFLIRINFNITEHVKNFYTEKYLKQKDNFSFYWLFNRNALNSIGNVKDLIKTISYEIFQ